MKTILTTGLICLALLLFIRCNKDEVKNTPDSKPLTAYKIQDIGIGEAHNQLVAKYQKAKYEVRTQLTLDDKIKLVDEYFIQKEISPLFSTYIDASPELYEFMETIQNNEVDFQLYYDLIWDLYEGEESTFDEYILQSSLLDILSIEDEISDKIGALYQIKSDLNVDPTVEEMLKIKGNSVIEISIASMEYWQDQSRGISWFAKDCIGAIYSINTGASNMGGVLGGPAGYLAVTLGVAAVASMM